MTWTATYSAADTPVQAVPFTNNCCAHSNARQSLFFLLAVLNLYGPLMQSRPLACHPLLPLSLEPRAANHAYPDRTSWYRRHHRRQGKPVKTCALNLTRNQTTGSHLLRAYVVAVESACAPNESLSLPLSLSVQQCLQLAIWGPRFRILLVKRCCL